MKIGYLVTARLKSTRLPKKLLLKINGTEMITYMIQRLKYSKAINEIIICTSTNVQDKPLEKIAKKLKVKCFRGSENDVLKRLYNAAVKFNLDYIVNITADCPLVSIEYVERIIDYYKKNSDVDLIRVFDLPHGAYSYGIKPKAIKKILSFKKSSDTEVWGRYFTDTGRFKVIDLEVDAEHKRPDLRMTLDYPEDFEFFKIIFEHFKEDIYTLTLDDIINYLDNNKSVVDINKNCEKLYKKRWQSQNKLEV
ncbi:NTP transferase domain-containing protein [Iocasia frigidifontis]|uniref:NTP transferase domain-containing protein n=1 Tax=Iocasia fonsfrigidae TaxID=2682810 RepID=A0A8A7KE92_9FIRM|nr:NTP transferase domain-containing protein [Iocasia fonsfrigidae]QTL99731.1 NTP transferase domain-containing protein [Iocasia fonsfrigidae]